MSQLHTHGGSEHKVSRNRAAWGGDCSFQADLKHGVKTVVAPVLDRLQFEVTQVENPSDWNNLDRICRACGVFGIMDMRLVQETTKPQDPTRSLLGLLMAEGV